jgi:xanthine dehydrogenase iron-sulfur cluster and FAD-binding subunit A
MHTGVYGKQAHSCKHVWLDVQSLSKIDCRCAGFEPVTGAMRDARFANVADDDTPLRIARP